MSSKKIRISRELMYILGMIFLPFAVNLMIKADFGLSMIAAPTYILSEFLKDFSVGQFFTIGTLEWILQALILALMCIVVKKFKVAYLTSFLSALIYGAMIDLFGLLMKNWVVDTIWLRVIFFVLGTIFTAFGVALFMNTYLAPCAYDYFVKTVVEEKKLDLRKVKLINDAVYLIASIILAFALFNGFKGVTWETITLFNHSFNIPIGFKGVTWGTLIVAIVNGNIISFFSKQVNKHIELYDHFPKISKFF